MPVVEPGRSVTQQPATKVWFAFSAATSEANTACGIAEYRPAAGLGRTTWLKAAFQWWGVPSLFRTTVFQPSRSSACLTRAPSWVHSGDAPQVTKSTVLPFGTGLPILTVLVIDVGCCSYLESSAWAFARPAE